MIPLVERVGLESELSRVRLTSPKLSLAVLDKNLILALKLKETANGLYKEGKYSEAILRYLESADLVDLEYLGDDFSKIVVSPVFPRLLDHIVACLSNMSLIFSLQKLHFRVIRAASLALSVVGRSKHPLKFKLHLRKGKALAEIGRFNEAMDELLKAKELKDDDEDLLSTIVDVETRIQKTVHEGHHEGFSAHPSPVASNSTFSFAYGEAGDEALKDQLSKIKINQ